GQHLAKRRKPPYMAISARFGHALRPAPEAASEISIDRSPPMNFPISLTVNGVRRDIELDDPRVTLLDLLRERLDLTGTKKGCDRGQCGECTVLVNGQRINS